MAVAAGLAGAIAPRTARAAGPDPDPWFGRDKALHFSASAALAIGGYGVGALAFDTRPPRFALGAGIALAAGVGKELWDWSGHGDASWRDLTWDMVGTAAGLAIAWAADRLITKFRSAPLRESRRPSWNSPTSMPTSAWLSSP